MSANLLPTTTRSIAALQKTGVGTILSGTCIITRGVTSENANQELNEVKIVLVRNTYSLALGVCTCPACHRVLIYFLSIAIYIHPLTLSPTPSNAATTANKSSSRWILITNPKPQLDENHDVFRLALVRSSSFVLIYSSLSFCGGLPPTHPFRISPHSKFSFT